MHRSRLVSVNRWTGPPHWAPLAALNSRFHLSQAAPRFSDCNTQVTDACRLRQLAQSCAESERPSCSVTLLSAQAHARDGIEDSVFIDRQ